MLLAVIASNLNLLEKIFASMHLIRNTYHFLFALYIFYIYIYNIYVIYIPDSLSGDGMKKEYLDFCHVAFITKFFRT